MGTKNNPGEFDCYTAAEPDEPLFVLRANDELAPNLVRFWATDYVMRKRMTGEWNQDVEHKADEARDLADQMVKWWCEENRSGS